MPILFNFHILLATFYTIFGTNILIQCPVPVPVCCMFFVSQNIHIKRSPNGWSLFLEYLENSGRKIHAIRCPRWPRGRGRACPPRRAPDPRGPPVRRLMLFFCRKKANIMIKIRAKDSPQSKLRISGYKRNGARAESGNAETERDRETDPISEGLSPLPSHGSQGPEGKPFSHLGRRSRKKKKKGGSLPLASGGAGTLPGAIIITAIFTNNYAIFTNISITFSHLYPAVHSPATRCTLYLNMVLYASYYYPMMCCHPMMFWVDILCLWVDWWSRLVWVVCFILVMSYCALHVAQACGIPVVGCCNMSMVYLLSALLEWQKHKHG